MEEQVTTHCPYCSLNCGLRLRVEHDEVVGTGKWARAPLSRGGLCTKGVTAWEQVHHADRLRTPLVRGRDGTLAAASWDAALDEAADGLLRIREEAGPDALAVLGGGSLTNEKAYLVGKFARLGLRTPHVDPNGRLCMTSAAAATQRAFGLDRAMTPLGDLADAREIVVVGANLADSFPLVLPLISAARRRGGRLVIIDPRGSKLLRDGDLHLPVRPGTDAVLAVGLLREIAARGWVDQRFVGERTTGYAAALAAARPWHPARVAEVTDVDADLLAQCAARIGRADRVMILHARGIEQQVMGTATVTAWINVALARGLAGRRGCGIVTLTGQRNGQGGREHGQRCDQLPGYRRVDDPADRAVVAARWGVDPAELPGRGLTYVEILHAARQGRIRGVLALSTNPAVSAPRGARAREALAALEHLVVIDPFLSETCRYASVVLPGSVFAEEEGTVTSTEGRVLRIDQAVPPQAVRGDLDVIRGLAWRLGVRPHFDFHSGREVFAELTAVSAGGPADYSGLDWDALRARGGIFWPAPAHRPHGTPRLYEDRFAHPDGRARFVPVEPEEPPVQPDDRYPLVLTTGRHRAHYLSGNQTRRIPAQVRQAPHPVLEVHPRTAARLGLEDGGRVRVRSRRGVLEVAWCPNGRLRPDTLFIAYHWEGINDLTDDALDPVSRIAGVKHTPVAVTPVAGDAPVTPGQRAAEPSATSAGEGDATVTGGRLP